MSNTTRRAARTLFQVVAGALLSFALVAVQDLSATSYAYLVPVLSTVIAAAQNALEDRGHRAGPVKR